MGADVGGEGEGYMEFVVMFHVARAANASITLGVVVGVLGNDMIAVWNGHALTAVLAEVFASRSRTAESASALVWELAHRVRHLLLVNLPAIAGHQATTTIKPHQHQVSVGERPA